MLLGKRENDPNICMKSEKWSGTKLANHWL